MAPGRNKTTWPKGQKPPVSKPKGAKAGKTKLKEALGLAGWQQFTHFMQGEGAEKLTKEIKKLKGKDYTTAMHGFMEFVKPKLQRTEMDVKAVVTDARVIVGNKQLDKK